MPVSELKCIHLYLNLDRWTVNLKELFIPPPIGLLVPTYTKSLQVKYIQGLFFLLLPNQLEV